MKASPLLRSFWCVLATFLFATVGRAIEPGPAQAAPAVANSECMDCHEAEFKPRKKGQSAEWVGVKPAEFAGSVHGKLNCVDCHTAIKETPHPAKLPLAQCISCHEKSPAKHVFHPNLALTPLPAGKDTSCKACHGTHGMVAVK